MEGPYQSIRRAVRARLEPLLEAFARDVLAEVTTVVPYPRRFLTLPLAFLPEPLAVPLESESKSGTSACPTDANMPPVPEVSVATHPGPKEINEDAVALCLGATGGPPPTSTLAIVALADGVSASPFGEIGAAAISLAALGAAARVFEGLDADADSLDPKLVVAAFTAQLAACQPRFAALAAACVEALESLPLPDPASPATLAYRNTLRDNLDVLRREDSLATTLVAGLTTPRFVLTVAYGNGLIALQRPAEGFQCCWAPDPEDQLGCYFSRHRFPSEPSFSQAMELRPGDRLWLATDGFSNPGLLAEVAGRAEDPFSHPGEAAGLLEAYFRHPAAGCEDNLSLAEIRVPSPATAHRAP